MVDIHLIFDPPASGRRNMAVDEVLLESAINDGIATVRIYAWSEPTVSLGYFQKADDIHTDPRFASLPAVRRLSGGGAILHRHEITYSLALPPTHPALILPLPHELRGSQSSAIAGEGRGEGQNRSAPTSLTPDPSPAIHQQDRLDAPRARERIDAGPPIPNPSRLYRLAHDAIIHVLTETIAAAPPDHPPGVDRRRLNGGVSALRLRGDVAAFDPPSSIFNPRPASTDPFLCFGRGDPNDIVLGPHKIAGSAQRRRRGAVLQHGSLLLRTSPHAEHYPGLCDLTGLEPSQDRLAEQIGRRIAESLGRESSSGVLSANEQELAESLARAKYSQLIWSRSLDPSSPSDPVLQTT